jgi:predicted AAA+ superfamily ATPase
MKITKEKTKYICTICHKEYSLERKNPNAKYCSFCRKNTKKGFTLKNITTGNIGAIGEVMVCQDLMRKNYDVFRAISPASKIDLIATKDKVIYKIEVRTGQYKKNNTLWYTTNKHADIMAIVTFIDNKIHYFPNPDEIA